MSFETKDTMRDFMNWFQGYIDGGGEDISLVFKMAIQYKENAPKGPVYRGVSDDQFYTGGGINGK